VAIFAVTAGTKLGVLLATLVAVVACSDHGLVVGDRVLAGSAGAASADRRDAAFILGADVSWVQEEEDLGTVYVDDGVEKDILEILQSHGFNAVRLRLFNDPSSPCRASAYGDETCGYQFEFGTRSEPYCDLDHTLQMAGRVKAAGMGLLVDFHLSDTWADPGDQNKPLAWEALSFDDLTLALEAWTRDSISALVAASAVPDLVQIGNEITPGILFPDGSSSATGNFPRFAALLKAGIRGVKSVDPDIRILLHIEKADSYATSDWWLSNALDHGVEFDILGQSCFTEWHGPPAGWASTFAQLAAKYPNLDFLIAEYSQEKRAANDIMWNLPDGRGLGTFVWEPTRWRETLFDRQGDQLVTNDLMDLYDQMADDYDVRD
jgi:arabinogalactan endo-1,4-beta-galactosidase